MRRIDFIINKVRKDTNNINPNRYNDFDIGIYLSNAQKYIQAAVVNANVKNDLFSDEYIFQTKYQQETYDLPKDIFSKSAINSVDYNSQQQNNLYSNWIPLASLTNPERNKGWGYIIRNDKIMISPVPQQNIINYIRIVYIRKLYELGPRYGNIISITQPVAGTSNGIIVFNLSLQDKTLKVTDYFDYISVVDKDGLFKQKELFIESLAMDSPAPGQATIETNSEVPLTDVVAGNFVVGGSRTTTNSELPDVCEQMLTNVAERFIQYVDSSGDIKNANVLTQDETQMIVELFKNHSPDPPYPPVMSGDYLNL